MEVAVDCSWIGDGVGLVVVPVGVVMGISGLEAGVGVAIAWVGSDVASGVGELAGNALVAVPGPGADATLGIKVTVDSGVSARATSWVGVGSPQAMGTVRVTRSAKRNRIFT